MSTDSCPFTLAACAELIHVDLPLIERVRRLHDAGFAAELWDWAHLDLPAMRDTGATFTSMKGYISGNLTDAPKIREFLDSAARSLEAADTIDCANLTIHGTGLAEGGIPVDQVEVTTPAMWLAARDTLAQVAEMGRDAGRVFILENLNLAVDHPGTPFNRAVDTLALVEAIGSPYLRMNLDLYHAQIGEGNLIELVQHCGDAIGEIQVADVPGRMEPGTGEVHYPAIARALDAMGYRGVVGLEGWASGAPDIALERFRKAFTLA
ncbi:TIM barrel protein [Salinisphaera sp. USBA-960]|uniref:TIM barrel protein n=1 Tax=Salinisphaera orenii TaxID=856731 RepID=UPI000DBE5E18|nr:TIM barrel protein [Salifodinibacter halophilus]NNC25663.1 TIM barrel protein [Salifodinibacter halophilus]